MNQGHVNGFLRSLGESFKKGEFQVLLVLIGFLLFIGTLFYAAVEGWTFVDAFYFSAVTLTTVGFGDVVPHTTAGKLFTVLYAFLGIGVIFGFFGLVGSHAQGRK